MTMLALLGLFLLKHALLAHVVDFGYSLSRSPTARFWWLGLPAQCAAEFVASMFILHRWTWSEVALALSFETAALVVSSLVERGAPLRKLLLTHFLCELAVLSVYGVIAWRLA